MAPRDGGQVDVRFSVANAEAVRQALAMLGKDGEKALKQFDAAAKPVPKSTALIGQALEGAKDQARAFAHNLGPAGVGLASFGTTGLVAAGAIGVAVLALVTLQNAANAFAADVVRLRDSAATLDLTATQLQAINDQGSKFALTEERIASALQRFTAQMEEFRRAQGPLFELVQRISPALAREMMTARGTAEAIDVLARVYEKAGDARQRLDRLIGGRQGGAVGLLFQEIGRVGGVNTLTAEFRTSGDALDEFLIKRVAILKTEIDDMAGDARRNFASIFSESLLRMQHRSTEQWLELSRAAKQFTISDDLKRFLDGPTQAALSIAPSWWQDLMLAWPVLLQLSRGPAGALAPDAPSQLIEPPRVTTEQLLTRARRRLAIGLATGGDNRADLQNVWRPGEQREPNAEALFNLERTRISLLGAAATPTEQLKLKTLELAAAEEKLGVSKSTISRALGAFIRAQEQAAVATRQQIGILTEEELVTSRLNQLQDLRAKGFIRSADEMARAEQLVRREVKETMQALEVRASRTPGLTRLIQDAGNLDKQLDQVAVGGANSFTTALTDIATRTQTAGAAFKTLGATIARSIAEMVIRMSIALPIARALQSALKGFLGGGVGGPDVGSGDIFGPGFANGGIFERGNVMRFASGGVVSRPTIFSLAEMGERGPEAIMPLRRTREGRLGVEVAGGGRRPITIGNTTIVVQGNADDRTVKAMSRRLDEHERFLDRMARDERRGRTGVG